MTGAEIAELVAAGVAVLGAVAAWIKSKAAQNEAAITRTQLSATNAALSNHIQSHQGPQS